MSSSARWPAERLDDLAQAVQELDNSVKRLTEDNILSRERVGLAIKRANDSTAAVKELQAYLRERDESQARERKSDRRWLVTTGLSSSGLVIAALALLLDKI